MHVELAGETSTAAAIEAVLRERLAGADVDIDVALVDAVDPAVVVTPAEARDDDLARVWIDLRGDERVTLYLVDGAWERVLVRHFPRHDNPEVTREELGHVVELALVALRAGERIGVGRDVARAELAVPIELPSPSPAPPPPAQPAERPAPRTSTPRTSLRARPGAFYEMGMIASGELRSGIGLSLDVRKPIASRSSPSSSRFAFGGLVAAQYRLPSEVTAPPSTTMSFEGGAVHALAIFAVALARSSELALGLGGGVEILRSDARSDAEGVRVGEGGTRASPVLRAMARYEHTIAPLQVFVGVGVDVTLDGTRYLLARSDETAVLFEPWRAHPFLAAGIQLP